jgi:pimeloyl-ACP methyl ester carboxylesterase
MSSATPCSEIFTLPDGRKLSYAIFGDRNASVTILNQHGLPSSRFEAVALDEAVRGRKIRVIAADRPGIGDSKWQPKPEDLMVNG